MRYDWSININKYLKRSIVPWHFEISPCSTSWKMKVLPHIDVNDAIIPDLILKDPPCLMLPSFTKIIAVCMMKDVTCIQIRDRYSFHMVVVCSVCSWERCLHKDDRWEPGTRVFWNALSRLQSCFFKCSLGLQGDNQVTTVLYL